MGMVNSDMKLHLSGRPMRRNRVGYQGVHHNIRYANPKHVAARLLGKHTVYPPSFAAMTIMGSWV